MSDRVAVFNHGRIEQLDDAAGAVRRAGQSVRRRLRGRQQRLTARSSRTATPAQCMRASKAARTVRGLAGGACRARRAATLCVRPERVVRSRRAPRADASNRLPATLVDAIYLGDHCRAVRCRRPPASRRQRAGTGAAALPAAGARGDRALGGREYGRAFRSEAGQNRASDKEEQMSFSTKQFSVTAVVTGAALAAAAGGALAQAQPLSVVSWGGAYQDAQKEVYFKPFRTQTGTKLVDESWDGGIGVLRTKIKGGANNWDVVQVEADELRARLRRRPVREARLGQDRRRATLPARTPCTTAASARSSTTWCSPTTATRSRTAPKSWADFFDTQEVPRQARAAQGRQDEPRDRADRRRRAAAGRLQDAAPRRPASTARSRSSTQLKPTWCWWKKRRAAAADARRRRRGDGHRLQRPHRPPPTRRTRRTSRWSGRTRRTRWTRWVIMKGTPNKADAEKFLVVRQRPDNQKNLPTKIATASRRRRAIAAGRPWCGEAADHPDNLKRLAVDQRQVLAREPATS